jgi:hypothetical protein
MLTAEERFRQARQKATMIAHRQVRQLLAGERDYVECWADLERQFIIDAISKAFEDGRRVGAQLSPPRS